MFDLFARIGRLFKGFFSLFVTSAEESNPKALLQNEIDNYNKAVIDYNANLGKQGGMVEKLKMQIAREEREKASAEAQAKACAAAGNMQRAGQFAAEAKRLITELAENKAQLQEAETQFKSQTRQRDAYVKEAKARIDRVKSKISKADMHEAQAKLATMASVQLFDASNSTLSKLEESLDGRIADARGLTRVANDAMSSANWIATEEEQRALEQQALAELLGTAAPAPAQVIQPAQLTAQPVQDASFIDVGAALKVESK